MAERGAFEQMIGLRVGVQETDTLTSPIVGYGHICEMAMRMHLVDLQVQGL